MEKKYIIGLDEGTTSCRTVVFDKTQNKIISIINKKFTQIFPKPGWVEHNSAEIFDAMISTLSDSIKKFNIKNEEVYGIGITNQRESVVAWQKSTGELICNSIVWQCRRTAEYCEKLSKNIKLKIKNKTGLIVDAYFSASKMNWILKNYPLARKLMANNDLCFGTMDTYLVYRLTNGKSFVTDTSNASRTMLFNINTLSWDDELCKIFNISKNTLPKVVNSSEVVGMAETIIGDIPIASMIGDQQASLFGQGCVGVGTAKATYGTGCFILSNVGDKPIKSKKMLSTVAWTIDNKTTYALEGSIFNAGSAIDWLIDGLKLCETPSETDLLAGGLENTNGVYFVPAFTGLGAPYWNPYATGTITGLTRGVGKNEIIRATLESMAYGTLDIVNQMKKEGTVFYQINCDGGVSRSNFLMQFQSNILNVPVKLPESTECTVLGAIYLAGLATGAYKSINEIVKNIKFRKTYNSNMPEKIRQSLYNGWKLAIKKTNIIK